MADFQVVHGKRYKAKLKLSGFEAMADNETVTNIFKGYGFDNITVTGEDNIRFAEGTFTGKTASVPKDAHIIKVEEMKEGMAQAVRDTGVVVVPVERMEEFPSIEIITLDILENIFP